MSEWKFAENDHVRVVQATDSTRVEEIGQTGIVVGYSSPRTVLVQMDSDVNPTPVRRYDNYYGGGELNPFPEKDLEIYDPLAVTSDDTKHIPGLRKDERMPAETIEDLKEDLRLTMVWWIAYHSDGEGWAELDTFVPNNIASLMTAAAWVSLKAVSSLSEHLREEGHDV